MQTSMTIKWRYPKLSDAEIAEREKTEKKKAEENKKKKVEEKKNKGGRRALAASALSCE